MRTSVQQSKYVLTIAHCTRVIGLFVVAREKPASVLAHQIGTPYMCQFGRVNCRHTFGIKGEL